MVLNQTKGIELHEFDKPFPKVKTRFEWLKWIRENGFEVLYQGKPSEVKEEMAKEWCEFVAQENINRWWKDYKTKEGFKYSLGLALDSFKSACTKNWIIITKKKI